MALHSCTFPVLHYWAFVQQRLCLASHVLQIRIKPSGRGDVRRHQTRRTAQSDDGGIGGDEGGLLSGLLLVCVPATLQTEMMLPLSGIVSLLGGVSVCSHAVFAALADATQGATPEERSQVFSVVEGMMWAGMLVGPYVGGVLAATIGDTNAILLSLAVGVCNLLITTGTFKETLPVGRRSPLRWRR
mmetsp:Transcript_154758/g.496114  ORF Transcript_154758/g.496114 Transcript_154758/m.496114 type:complete len:187 (-) Transcript_154758:127-687(-)